MQTLQPADTPHAAATTHPAPHALCLNCGAPLTSAFCPDCGQRNVPPYPSLRELATDAFSELAGWDGRIATTFRSLFARPGLLTREFLEGRRARYLSPFRLYLMASVTFFLLSAAAPDVEETLYIGTRPLPGASTPAGRTTGNAQAQQPDMADLTPEERASLAEQVEKAPALIRPFMRRAIQDPQGLRRDTFAAMPRMLFVLLPLFAVIVALFYRGRKYPEHLYFSVHLHAFIFSALALIELVKFTRSVPVVVVVSTTCLAWIAVYATLALRRVYGGSIVRTMAKELGIGTIYFVTWAVAFFTTLYIVSI